MLAQCTVVVRAGTRFEFGSMVCKEIVYQVTNANGRSRLLTRSEWIISQNSSTKNTATRG